MLRPPLVYLLVEGDLASVGQLPAVLQEAGYVVRQFSTIEAFRDACTAAESACPDAVVMDLVSADGPVASARLLAELKGERTSCPPVVFLSAHDSLPARLAGLRAGVKRYLVKPVAAEHLLNLLDELTRRHPPEPYRVLLVDADPQALAAHAAILRAAGMVVVSLSDPLYTLERAEAFAPDVFVIDIDMPDMSGPELATVLREHEAFLYQPIVYLTTGTDVLQQILALDLGGDDVLGKPVAPDYLLATVATRARRFRQDDAVRRRLRLTLYEREREHLALGHHAIVSVADAAGKITHVNDKFCEISGYAREELLGQNHRLIKSAEHPPSFYREMWETITQGRVWQGEVCNRRKDGRLYWVDSTVTPFLDKDGFPYQYISIRTDITALKEQAVRLKLQASAMEASANGIVIADARADDLPLIYVNPAFERISGYTAAELLGRNCRCLQRQDRAQPALDELRLALREAKPAKVLLRNYRKSGELFWNELALAPVRDDDGAVTHFIGVSNDVTAHKLAEQAAEIHKERLRRGQQYANIGTWDWNIQTGELYWTERIAPLFGYPEGDLETSYDNFLNAIHPDDRQKVIDAVNACVERDVPYEIEHRVVWPDGTVRWLLERGAVSRDAAGKPLHMLGVVQDVDDRKRAELALAERERQLREAQQIAHIGSYDWNPVSGELRWSDEHFRLWGLAPQSCTPDYALFRRGIHPDDVARLEAALQASLQGGGDYDCTHRVVWPDGSEHHIHGLGEVFFDGAGRAVRMVGTVQDITERKRVELELATQQQQLLEAQRLARLGNWSADLRTGQLVWSDEIYRIFGHEPGSFAPSVAVFHAAVHPDDLEGVHASELRAAQTGRHDIVHRIVRPDGEIRHVHELARVERDAAGSVVRLIGTVQDVTEQVLIKQALIAARDEAERANRAKSDFLSSMSHELRTPMNAILGFGQLLEYDASLPGEHLDSVREILKAGRHLLELINEVLDLARIESGSIDLSLEAVEVCPLVDECIGLMTPLADRRGIALSHDGLDDAVVRADRMRLKQALINLLSNAIKYNRDGGSVRLDVRRAGEERVRLRVTDTGPGIAPERVAELFQPFNRLGAENGEIEGTGIGLTITQRLVEMMGGSIGVESQVGLGSSFWIELPRETIVEAADGGTEPTGSASPAKGREAGTHTILYIEDNPSNLKLVAQMLGRRRHVHLLTAHTPELGIELARARHPDLILLDINMPGMNGYQVLQVLKADPGVNRTPVVAVTANALPSDIERGRAAGFADYLTKPIDLAAFLATVDRCLAGGGG